MRRAGGHIDGALAAVSGALRADPLHFMALLSRARLIEATGDEKEAGRAYTQALSQAPNDESLPPSILTLVAHAKAASTAYQANVDAIWEQAITHDKCLPTTTLKRLERFKTNALRDTRVYHSEPSHYHYPGLVEREFHERDDFPWLPVLEMATASITREFESLIRNSSAHAEPYIQYPSDQPVRQWADLNHSMDWTAVHLLKGGHRIEQNADRCPETMAVLAGIDQPTMQGRSPNAMFSMLKPKTKIPPHTGIANTRLVCHLPLIVPDKCWFRVGAERREWRVGQAFVFDDTIEHEAVNDSDVPRIILIIDVWHPGLDASERAAIQRVMEADEILNGAPL